MSIPFSDRATPVIIAGAPRSGTTFLTASLNSHPQVLITNELRSWSLFNDVRRRASKPSQLLPEHPLREAFRDALTQSFATLFRDFYRQHATKHNLGCSAESGASVAREIRAFGDKNPGYADPHQPGCLTFIAEALPDAQFIHIHRDPRACVASYRAIPVYSNDLSRCVDVWKRHTSNMASLHDVLGGARVMEIPYEVYVTPAGEDILRRIESHVGLSRAIEPAEFLRRERECPIPYRAPTTPLELLGRSTWRERLSTDEIHQIEDACGPLMERYGYTTD